MLDGDLCEVDLGKHDILLVLATTISLEFQLAGYSEIVNFIIEMLCCFESMNGELEYYIYALSLGSSGRLYELSFAMSLHLISSQIPEC